MVSSPRFASWSSPQPQVRSMLIALGNFCCLFLGGVQADHSRTPKNITYSLGAGSAPMMASDDTKILVLYFPQYHNDKLNNELWGDGFTDWDSLKRAPMRNKNGGLVPRPSADTGYYDLAKHSTRKRHRHLALEHGVDAFIYHHYWFHQPGQGAPLSTPLEKMLVDGEPNMPFALNWAKEHWVATWLGKGKTDREMLVESRCPPINDPLILEHYAFLRKFFTHKNYILVNGAPLFSVYGWDFSKPCRDMLQKYRELAIADGFAAPGLHLLGCKLQMAWHEMYTGVALEPEKKVPEQTLFNGDLYYPYSTAPEKQLAVPERCFLGMKGSEKKPTYVSTLSEFDNTPRRNFSTATIWERKFSPKLQSAKSFEYDIVQAMMYEKCCQNPEARERGGKFIVLNAWNEWGEGMSLEPSAAQGPNFLIAIKRAKRFVQGSQCDWSALQKYNAEMST